jgi:ATP/maltotriose-dependent transcriptional regulator MalT
LTIAGEAADDLLARGKRSGDPSQLLQAHHAGWATAFSRGDLGGVIEHSDQGICLYESEKHAKTAFDFGNHDPGVCCRSFRARALVLMGRTDDAIKACRDAINSAKVLAHPFSEALAEVFAASVYQVIQDAPAVKEHASAAATIAREQGFKLLLAWAGAFEGWAEIENGAGDQGLSKIGTQVELAKSIGSSQFQTHLLALLAEAHLTKCQYWAGLQVIAEALEAAHGGERFYEAELYRLRGELLRAQNSKSEQIESSFLRSYEIATSQKAHLLSLRSSISLARLWQERGRRDEATKLLLGIRDHISGRISPRDQEVLDLISPSGSLQSPSANRE